MLDTKLETFLTVAELRSYTLTAQTLHITQPAVTQHIRKLEEHYGCKLIDFSGHQLSLTAAGELLYRYGTLQNANEHKLREHLAGLSRRLRVGATLSIADYYLPQLLRPYLRQHTGDLQLRVGNTEKMLTACLHGVLDCAFLEGAFDADSMVSKVFRQARFLPVAAAGHPLAGRHAALRDTFSFPLVLREPGSGTRAILESRLHEESLTPECFASVLECGSFRMIKEILKQTQAVSFMYEEVAAEEVADGSLVFLDLADCRIQRSLQFVYPENSMTARSCQMFFDTYIIGKNLDGFGEIPPL